MKKIIMISVFSISTLLSTTTVQARCGIDCWLSNTFSTRDFVGDWLRGAFSPVHNSGNGKKGSNKELIKSYERANKIASTWKSGQKLVEKELKYKPTCKLQKLLDVVNKERSPEVLIKECFLEKRK